MADNYDDYSREELIRELRSRDRRPRFGLIWEKKEIEHERAINDDFVVLEHDPASSCGEAPYLNLIIEGDNFDALRYLRMTHAGKIKCIYIDPPYNTGNRDFIYNDRFVDKDDSYRHSKWLEFMHRRLLLARELLAEDGVIFVSIDDNEQANLKLLMDKVFGESNFVSSVCWIKRVSPANDAKYFSSDNETILIYANNINGWKPNRLVRNDEQISNYKNPDNDYRGAWNSVTYTCNKSINERPNLYYPIAHPTTGVEIYPSKTAVWKFNRETHEKHKSNNELWWGKNNESKQPRLKRFLSEMGNVVPRSFWKYEDCGHTQEARSELLSIIADCPFTTPKPVRLIERILRIATNPNDIILDFFAGSGTTAHAVMKLNAEDGGKRRFILVSNTEATESEPDKNLCRDVCAERVRRVIQGYTNKKGEAVAGLGGGPSATLTTGFAYFRSQRHPAETLLSSIQHEEIWTTLQLIHAETVSPYQPNALLQRLWLEGRVIMYLPSINDAVIAELRGQLSQGTLVEVYSWQPGLLRQFFEDDRMSFVPVPQYLIDRFNVC